MPEHDRVPIERPPTGVGSGPEAPGGPDALDVLRAQRRWLLRLLATFLIGATGAITFYALKLPLPIFLGALTFALIAAVARFPIMRPQLLSGPMRAAIGVSVGTAFTPALLEQIGGMALSLALLVPFTLTIMIGGSWFLRRFAGLDPATAFFASVPGGLADVTAMAGDAGADQRAVTLIHAMRLVMVVFMVPIWLQVADGTDLGGRIAETVHIWQLPWWDGVVLLALAAMGWWGAKRLGLAGAVIVGPMTLSGIVHAAGLTTAVVPIEVLIAAQITIGIALGAQFVGVTLRDVSTSIFWGAAFSLLLIVFASFATVAVSAITGFDQAPVLLAFAPAGQMELNLIAFILGVDVAYVALHHLARLAIVILGAQVIFARHPEWQRKLRGPS